VIRVAVMMYVLYPLSLCQVEDILFERGIDISHETVWFWWNRLGRTVEAMERISHLATLSGAVSRLKSGCSDKA
jgi:transposase-like protein